MENIESFRNFLLGSFPKLKLPKGKKVVELSLGKGILMCCMVKKDGVMVFLYSGGRIPADEIFSKLNSLGVTGRVINNKYKIDPNPGSRNPNIVRIDLLVPFKDRDLNNQDLRNEVLDVYNQLIDLCMPLNPDAVVQKETEDNDAIKTFDEKITSNNEIKISCEGDGFRYEYLEDGSQKIISKCSGPLTHNLKIKITSDGKNNEFSIKDISCDETYDKIISSEFEEYLEKNDMFEIPTTLYQFRQNGTYFFDALILDDDEKFDINRLEAELIIPMGDLFKQSGLKQFIYEKNNGEKVKIKIQDGQYNETNWDPVESNYDLEIEHYTEKLTQNQYWHSKIFFNEDPKGFLKDYDDIGYIESVGNLLKDQRFKSPFLEAIFEIGFNTWAKKEILDEVLKSFEQNSNCSIELIKMFKERIKSYEGKRKLIEQAKTITETNNGEIDDFLGDENISKDLLEALYDLNIENWVNNRDDFENNWSIGLIISNPQSSKSLLKKVFKHLENTLYEDKEVQFSDLAKNINTKLGDEDWAKKLYHIVEEIVFSDDYIKENGVSKASELALDITTSLKDKSWGMSLFEKIEKLDDINEVVYAMNLAKSFHDDTGWCKRTYHSVLNNDKYTQSSKDLILLAHTIACYDKKNMDISIEIFKKAEELVIYLSDYMKLAGSVSNKDGLNDSEWGENLFQKGLQQFSGNDYVEHPKVKEWELKNEVSKIIGQINNDYNFPWETMKEWLKPLEDINNKLASGNSKIDAVKDYLTSFEPFETEIEEKNNKSLSGKLNIIIEGKMSQCRIGEISHEMRNALKIASESYIDEVSNESELLEMIIRGDFVEVYSSIPKSILDSDCKELKKLLDKDRGEIFEELNIFYEPFVIDDDNKILIKINDYLVYEGLISQLGKERFELGYDKEKVESEFKLKISEILKNISFKNIQSETDQLRWSDDISFENQESIIQSFEDGENLSKYGWWLYCINNSKYENEKNVDNWDNRVSIIEYGSFKIEFQPIQVENFDWLKFIWRVDGDIEEAELTGSEYMLSNILYADENKGIVELEPSIREFDLKDVKCGFQWPGT